MPLPADRRSPLAWALAYAALGWRVLPVNRDKIPFRKGASFRDATRDERQLRAWWNEWPQANVAIAMAPSGLVAIDIDPRNGGRETWDELQVRHGKLASDVMAFTGGGGEHHVFRLPPGVALPDELGPGVDVKLNGYIVVEPSIHSSGRRYGWEASSNPLEGVVPPLLPQALWNLRRTTANGKPHPSASTPVDPVLAREAREAIYAIDPEPRQTWLNAGMALHSTGWGTPAYAIWTGWSQQSSRFDPVDQRRVWDSFHEGRDDGIRLSWIFAEAQRCGWQNPRKHVRTIGQAADEPRPEPPQEDEPKRAEWLEAIASWRAKADLDALTRIEPVEWLWQGWLQRRIAGVLVAEGGIGKTTLLLHLMCCIATGRPCFGCAVRPGSSVLLSLDDPQTDLDGALAEMLHGSDFEVSELEAIRQHVRLISLMELGGCKQFAMPYQGAMVPTGIESQIADVLRDVPDLRMVSMDTLRMFSGGESNDELTMTLATQASRSIANQLGCAVVAPHHTGKGNSREKVEDQYVGAGSSAIADNFRFVLRLRRLTTEEAGQEFDGWTARPGAHLLKLSSLRGALRATPPDPILIERDGFALRHINAVAVPKAEQSKTRERYSDIFQRLLQNGMPLPSLRMGFYEALGDKSLDTKQKAFARSIAIAKENGICDIAEGRIIMIRRNP